MSAAYTSMSPAVRDFAHRHRLRWWEPLPWVLAIAFFYVCVGIGLARALQALLS